MGNRIAVRTPSKRTRIMAIAAAGAVLLGGIGITSLAAWTDQVYVQGGFNGTPGLGSSSFEVQQEVQGDSAFTDRETAGTAGLVDFGSLATTLSPNTTVYGWVQLRTKAGSIAGDLTLKSTLTSTTTSDLSGYLTYGARIVGSTATCSDGTGWSSGTVLVADGQPLTTSATSSFSLAANATQTKVACFAITMPAGTSTAAMGKTLTPVWYFDAISS